MIVSNSRGRFRRTRLGKRILGIDNLEAADARFQITVTHPIACIVDGALESLP
jgi:hypothetical protein